MKSEKWKVEGAASRGQAASRQRNLVSCIYFKASVANLEKVPEYFFHGNKLFSSWNEVPIAFGCH